MKQGTSQFEKETISKPLLDALELDSQQVTSSNDYVPLESGPTVTDSLANGDLEQTSMLSDDGRLVSQVLAYTICTCYWTDNCLNIVQHTVVIPYLVRDN